MFCGQDSIGSFASSYLGDDLALRVSREFGWMTTMRDLLIREEDPKYPRHSRIAHTRFGGNNMNGVMIGGQRKDIFL